MDLRNFLNRLLWDCEYNRRIKDFDIIYIHRGAPGNTKRINASLITKITKGDFQYTDPDNGMEKEIPLHRIIKIIDTHENRIYYLKRGYS